MKKILTNYYNIFPKNRDFFFLDTEDNIKQFKTTTTKDPEYIYVAYESKKEKKTCEKICRRKDFLSDYKASIEWADVILAGPGLGTGNISVQLLKALVKP